MTDMGLTAISTNLGVSLEYIVFIIFLFGSIIFYAADFKLGVILSLFISSGLFMWFKHLNINYVPFIVFMFISLILMAITLFFVSKTASTGAVI